MRDLTRITIEHVVIASTRSFEQVNQALEKRLGLVTDWDAIGRQLLTTNASWEQATQIAETLIGISGFSIFGKIEEGVLLSLFGKPRHVCQYLIGNPLLAVQMFAYEAEVALYAPLRLVIYEDNEGTTYVAYDRFTSQIVQYQSEEITHFAQFVEQRLVTLVAEVVGEEQEMHMIKT